MVRWLADFLAEPLCKLFATSLTTAVVPTDWRLAIICPMNNIKAYIKGSDDHPLRKLWQRLKAESNRQCFNVQFSRRAQILTFHAQYIKRVNQRAFSTTAPWVSLLRKTHFFSNLRLAGCCLQVFIGLLSSVIHIRKALPFHLSPTVATYHRCVASIP